MILTLSPAVYPRTRTVLATLAIKVIQHPLLQPIQICVCKNLNPKRLTTNERASDKGSLRRYLEILVDGVRREVGSSSHGFFQRRLGTRFRDKGFLGHQIVDKETDMMTLRRR